MLLPSKKKKKGLLDEKAKEKEQEDI